MIRFRNIHDITVTAIVLTGCDNVHHEPAWCLLRFTGRLQCDCHLSRVIYKNIFTTKHLITLIHQLLKQHLTTASSGDNASVDDENQECAENHLSPPPLCQLIGI